MLSIAVAFATFVAQQSLAKMRRDARILRADQMNVRAQGFRDQCLRIDIHEGVPQARRERTMKAPQQHATPISSMSTRAGCEVML